MEIGGLDEQVLLWKAGLVDLARTGSGIHVVARPFRTLLSPLLFFIEVLSTGVLFLSLIWGMGLSFIVNLLSAA